MPYSFIDIEKEKKWIIWTVFLFLLMFYFLVAEVLWLITKLYFLAKEIVIHNQPIFSLAEASTVFTIALVVAFIHWRVSTHNMIDKIVDLLKAQEPDPEDSYHQIFKNVVDEVSVAAGGMNVQGYVIPSSGLNAFAVSDFRGHNVIGITEGLLAKLNRSQLEAVVGHEAAHIAREDSLITTITCSLFGIYSALLSGISIALERPSDRPTYGRRSEGGWPYLVIIFVVLSLIQGLCFLLNMFLSRQKETRADAVAVKLTRDPLALAEALYIISRGWRGIGEIPDALSPIFIMSPDYKNIEESEGFFADIFSTHPPIKNRLGMLLDMVHTDASQLPQLIQHKDRVQAETGTVPVNQGPENKWFMYKDNSWQGPFGVEELLNLGVNPQSWVSHGDEKTVIQASDSNVLNAALADRFSGKPVREDAPCPRCKQPLGEVLYEGAPVLKCHYCGGIFAHRNTIMRIMVREDFSFSPSIVKSAELALKTSAKDIYRNRFTVAYELNCPQCKNAMVRGFYSPGYPIAVDKCEQCDAVWFEQSEFEALQYIFEKFNTDEEKMP